MKPEAHREVAERILRSLEKLGPQDYEMKIEAAMLAGTHLLNEVLHRAGVTASDRDVMHTYLLTINEYRRLSVANASLVTALSEIEDLRPPFVRGNAPGGEAAAELALALLATLSRAADVRGGERRST